MPIVVVEQEKDLSALTSRLLRARTSKAATERAERAIREANPGVDLDRLRPGTVLVVPPLKEALVDTGDRLGPAVDALVDQLTTELTALETATEVALAEEAAERATVTELVRSVEGRRGVRGESTVKDVLAQLRGTLQADESAAGRRTAELQEAVRHWQQDLDTLRQLG